MPWKLTNVALDPVYAMKRRTAAAARLEMEPVIAGNRLRLRQVTTISDQAYEVNKARIALFEGMGVLVAEKVGGAVIKEPPPPPEPPPAPKKEPEPAPPVIVGEDEWDEPPAKELEPLPVPAPKTSRKKKSSSRKGSKE